MSQARLEDGGNGRHQWFPGNMPPTPPLAAGPSPVTADCPPEEEEAARPLSDQLDDISDDEEDLSPGQRARARHTVMNAYYDDGLDYGPI